MTDYDKLIQNYSVELELLRAKKDELFAEFTNFQGVSLSKLWGGGNPKAWREIRKLSKKIEHNLAMITVLVHLQKHHSLKLFADEYGVTQKSIKQLLRNELCEENTKSILADTKR